MSDQDESAPRRQSSTEAADYARRLDRLENSRWKRILDVQAPYRRNLRRLSLGRTIDVGCGIGRNLAHLSPGSLGVDHNEHSVRIARQRGLSAMTVEEYQAAQSDLIESFDALLASHLIEHMPYEASVAVLRSYLPSLRPGARCVFICPQELGYRTDATHVQFTDFDYLRAVAEDLGLAVELQYSFPFHRLAGWVFPYNEFIQVSRYQPV